MNNEHRYFSGSSNKAVVFFHGYGANMDDLAPLQNYLDPKGVCHWYFPNGPVKIPFAGMWEGRAWFPIDMAELERAMQVGTHRRFSDKSPAEFLTSLSMMLETISELQKKHEHVIVGGFSQGAMLASHIASRLPVEALVILSGTLLDQSGLAQNYHTRSVPFFQSHGDQDPLLGLGEAKALYESLETKGFKGLWAPFRGGHEIPEGTLRALGAFLTQFH